MSPETEEIVRGSSSLWTILTEIHEVKTRVSILEAKLEHVSQTVDRIETTSRARGMTVRDLPPIISTLAVLAAGLWWLITRR